MTSNQAPVQTPHPRPSPAGGRGEKGRDERITTLTVTTLTTTLCPPDAEALYSVLLELIRAEYGAALTQTDGNAALVGIYSGGVWIAERLAHDLGCSAYGVINVALHRDDYADKGLHAQAKPTSLPFNIQGRRILLIDDVLYTGRTIRAALNELYDYGRPAAVELAVLVDRGGRELPVAARFVGAHVTVPSGETLSLARAADGRFAFASRTHADNREQ